MIAVRARAAVVATAALVLTAAGAPAFAGGYLAHDPAGDQVSFTTTYDTSGHTTPTVRQSEPTHRDGDVTSASVAYRPHRLVVVLQLLELDPSASTSAPGETNRILHAVNLRVQTRRPARGFVISGVDDGVRARWGIGRAGTSRSVRCPGFTHAVTGDSVTLSVPRACLGRPGALRAATGSQVIVEHDTSAGGSQVVYADDAQTVGVAGPDALVFGRWLHRG